MTTRSTPRTENFDMESFFDFNQSTTQASPLTASNSRMDAMSPYDASQEQRQFSGPSHDYNQYKQQVGLPMGSVVNMPSQNMFSGYSSGISDFGYDGMAGWSSGIDLDADVSLDFSNPTTSMPNMFLPTTSMDSSMDNFVNPLTIGQYDETTSNVGRLWPGMHSQQAQQLAMQKAAQNQAMQQRQMRLQAQQAHYRQPSVASQGQMSVAASSAGSTINNNNVNKLSSQPTEPHVQESITRLLNQMRQKSAVNDDADSGDEGLPNLSRSKKDEEEMDEDERLLASEEGKKLSSKERRQLRNKVSARAFRSRRKEYIGQLEGEVNLKVAEAQSLRNENQALKQENERYRGLIETLLRHPAFTPFIQDISKDPSVTGTAAQIHSQLQATQPPVPQQSQQPVQRQQMPHLNQGVSSDMQQQQFQQDMKTEYNGYDGSQIHIPSGSNQHINVAMLPENDFSKLHLHGLARTNDFMSLQAVNAYAMTGLSCGPDPLNLLVEDPVSSLGDSNLDILLAKLDGAARQLNAQQM